MIPPGSRASRSTVGYRLRQPVKDAPTLTAFDCRPYTGSATGGRISRVLDFGGVPYISSVGLRVLMIAAKQMRSRHARIAVAGLQPVVAEIFAISRFDKVLEVFPAVRDALAAIAPIALGAYDAG